jgi:hypothetical protein
MTMPSDPRVPLPQEEAPRDCTFCGCGHGEHFAFCREIDRRAPSPSGAGAPPADPEFTVALEPAYLARLEAAAQARGASSGGAPAGDPTGPLGIIDALEPPRSVGPYEPTFPAEPTHERCAHTFHGERQCAYPAGHAGPHRFNHYAERARESGSVSPPPSGEERPALTREGIDVLDRARVEEALRSGVAALIREAARELWPSEASKRHEWAAILDSLIPLIREAPAVPSATGETARLREVLADAQPGNWRHHADCPAPRQCLCGLWAFRDARAAALFPTQQETR